MQNTRRDFLKLGALSAASSMFLPRDVFTSYEAHAEESGNDVVLRCCVMSDVHFNGSESDKEYERFNRAIKFMYDYSSQQAYKKFDALVVVGDMSNHGVEKELSLFKKAMDAAIKPGTQKVLCMGNHEFYGGNQKIWQSIFGVEPNKRYEVNGFRFIGISPEKGTMKDGDYLYALDFLKAELEDAYAQDTNKPIFVFQHYPVSPTVYGGRGADDWGAEDMFDTLQAYPTVVNFSGHTHYPINDPRCAWQGCFSAFGTGTLSYVCHGHEGRGFRKYLAEDSKYAQFYVMEVRKDNSVTLKPYDLLTNSFFDVVYFVAKPGAVNEYTYTDKRYYESEKPTWRDDTKVVVNVEDAYLATVEFKQAYCKDVVLGYRAELERQDPKTKEWNADSSCCFWSYYFLRDTPEKACGELVNLEPRTKYRGKLFAMNPFMRESENAIEFEFETKDDPYKPADGNAPEPKANFYDLHVEKGKFVNTPSAPWTKDREWRKIGSPKIVKDADLGAEVVLLDGKSAFKSQSVDDDYKKLNRATIGGKFCVDQDAQGSNCILSDTQLGGLAITYNADVDELQLWMSINGSYQQVNAKIERGKYFTAYGTYDGRTIVFYVNGAEAGRVNIRGRLTYTSDATAKAFDFGADPNPDDANQSFFKGKIAYARLYSWPLTAEQVANLSK